MTHRVKSLREKLDFIYDDNTKLHLNPHSEEKGTMRKHTHSISSIPDVVVGREDDVKEIKKLLHLTNNVSSSSSDNVISVVPIVGMGGMGKTTLAQLVYNDRIIKEEFELRLWVCVSEAFEVDMIVQKILESAVGEKKQGLELNTLTNHLIGEISKKKYFLVLDDVWNFDTEKWDVLKSVLKKGSIGSKILVTTRFEEYARKMSSGSPLHYTLSGLSSPQSWSLLRQIVFGSEFEDERHKNIINNEEIKTEIMKKSAGVPLAVKTVASLLHFKNPQTEWLPFLRSSELLDAKHNSSIGHNLKLSYDYLPSHLKQCFLHCCLYPKGFEIRVRTLIYQWVVLGFIKSSPNDSPESLVHLGLQCFMDLSWRSFFQELQRDESNNVATCKMHDLIHDLAVSVAGSSYSQINGPTNKISEKTYHISLNLNFWSPSDVIDHLGKVKRLQTFSLPYQFCYQPGTSWEDSTLRSFFSKFGSLRLLDLPNLGLEILPHDIQKLKHLRYFNLSFSEKMTRLPNSITMLQNLQVLVLYHCKSLQELPRDIRKLVNLWYLNCSKCSALTHMPMGLGELTRLEILTSFVVGKDSSASKHIGGLDELYRLNNLQGELNVLNLRYLRGKTSLSSLPSLAFEIGASANMKGKPRLEWLGLNWDDGNIEKEEGEWEECLKGSEEDIEWDESLLEGLQPHSNLHVFGVSGYKGMKSPGWISSLTNLVTFHLVWCSKVRHGLHHLQGLRVLQNLLFVGLMELEYMDEDVDVMNEEVASKPFFPCLEDLNVINCPKLKGWRRKQPPHFPKLSKLAIQRCPLLTSVPPFPTLDEKLVLIDTSLQPLLRTMNSSCSSSEVDVQYPLSKLKRLRIGSILNPPKKWLQGMQHLTSLQDIVIENCAGLEDTLYWDNISQVPNVSIDGFSISRYGKSEVDDDTWKNYFPMLLKLLSKRVAENNTRQCSK